MGEFGSLDDEVSNVSSKPAGNNDNSAEGSSQSGEDGFKKPSLSSHTAIRKNIMHKYMQKNRGFVSGGSLTTVSSEDKKESVEASQVKDDKTKAFVKAPPPAPPALKYEVPHWAGEPTKEYFLEEIKSGVVEKTLPLKSKTFFTFGRLETCDVPMAHPTVSRYHAILQFRAAPEGEDGIGFYLYDLGSTHGTFVNKYRVKSRVYGRLKVGHMIKIGCSSRFFILQGPEDDVEEESELTFTELKGKRDEELRERKLAEERKKEEEELEMKRQEQIAEERGISWGMGEDAEEETDLSVNPYAVVTNEELYIDDPKKALRQWFDREGEEVNYEIEKAERGMVVCKITLPVDGVDGQEVTIEVSARNKREAQVQCALEACRSLDKLGVFRPSERGSKKAKRRNWEENDFYDSDEDSFYDRTGDLESKRRRRMEKAGKISESVETYETLKAKYSDVVEGLEKAEKLHARLLVKVSRAEKEASEDVDELDAFMANLKKAVPTKAEVKTAQMEVDNLKKEEARLRALVNIAKPASLPELNPPKAQTALNVSSSSQLHEEETPFDVTQQKPRPEDNKSDVYDKTKVIGPSMPPPEVPEPKEPKPPKPPRERRKKGKPKMVVAEDEFEDLVWRPPQGQTGDGRTSLNDKLGY